MSLRSALLAFASASLLSAGSAAAQDPAQDPAQNPTTPPAPPEARSAPGGPMSGGRGMGGGGGLGPPAERAQIAPWADRLFTRLDADQDDRITGAELQVLTQGPMGPMGGGRLRAMISQSDRSGDARISREELAAGAERMFDRMDRNGDGRLDESERPAPPAPRAAPMPIPTPQAEPFPMPDNPGGAV